MSKIRIYELAKQIEKDSMEIITKLKEFGVEVKSHMSSISEEDANRVKEAFAGNKNHDNKSVKEKKSDKKEDKKIEKPEDKKAENKKSEKPVHNKGVQPTK